MKRKNGETYLFDSAEQTVWDVWGRPIKVKGKHIFTKDKDTLMDKLYGRSWYVLDGALLVYVERGSYIETRCLTRMKGAEDE